MTMEPGISSARALRQEFDASFAKAPETAARQVENLLAVRIGEDHYALRLAQIAGLYKDRFVVPMPTPVPDLLGLAGFRGQTVPVYDLARLLGYGRGSTARWLVVVKWRSPLALPFTGLDGHRIVGPDQLVSAPSDAAPDSDDVPWRYARDALEDAGGMRPILDLTLVMAAIDRRVQAARPHKER